MISVNTVVGVLGCVQGVFVFVLLLLRKEKTLNTKLVLALLSVFIIELVWAIIYSLNDYHLLYYFMGLETSGIYLIGPILYLYIKSQFLGKDFKLTPLDYLHFIPGVAIYILLSPYLFRDAFIGYLNHYGHIVPDPLSYFSVEKYIFELVLREINLVIYISLIIHFLFKKRSSKEYSQYNSEKKKKHLGWITLLLCSYILFDLIGLVDIALNHYLKIDFSSFYLNVYLWVILVFIISGMTYTDKDIILNPIELLKLKSTNLKKLDKNNIEIELEAIIKVQKAYLDKGLTLSSLASQMNITTHQLSEFLNVEQKQSFNDYINSFRIEYAKELLKGRDGKLYTLEGIAEKSGFNSLSTFHRHFKKHTDLTPKQWSKR